MANSWATLPGQGHRVWKTGNCSHTHWDWHRARPRGCDNPEQGTGTLTYPRVTVVLALPLPYSGARCFHRAHATGPLSLISDNKPRLGSSLHGIQHSITVKISVLSVFHIGHSATDHQRTNKMRPFSPLYQPSPIPNDSRVCQPLVTGT